MTSIPSLNIFLVKLSPVEYEFILNFYSDCINNNKKGIINYANTHTINLANRNQNIRATLNSFDITHPDGIGIWFLSKLLGLNPKFNRFNWTDYAIDFLEKCQLSGWKIFFLGGKPEVISKAVRQINLKLPKLKITGFHNGFENLDNPELIDVINRNNPQIIWVGLGVPKQEEWILKYKDALNCYVLHSVGDIFSELAGTKVRGPKLLRKLGFEWVFRIVTNPQIYFRRYVNSFWCVVLLLSKNFYLKIKSL